jgi:hypothetical protein
MFTTVADFRVGCGILLVDEGWSGEGCLRGGFGVELAGICRSKRLFSVASDFLDCVDLEI